MPADSDSSFRIDSCQYVYKGGRILSLGHCEGRTPMPDGKFLAQVEQETELPRWLADFIAERQLDSRWA